jgi:predicted permease
MLGRIRAFFHTSADDRDLDQELETHLAMLEEERVRRGMAPEQARRAARLELGGLAQLRDAHREVRGLPLLETILQDMRYTFRTLRRDASLTTFAILIVGLGVGASTTVFSVFHALLLRPLPFEEPNRLIWIANGDSENLSNQTVQVNNLIELREQNRSFSGIAGYSPFYGAGDIRLTGTGEPERLTGAPVTETFFQLLGVEPGLGRFFTAEECRWGAPKTVILSYRFWQRRFAADPGIVGRAITLDGQPVTVIGVLPESFDFPAVFAPGTRVDLFSPFPLSPETNRRGNTLALLGRLNPGANLEGAQVEARLIGDRIQSGRFGQVSRNGFNPRLSTLRDRVSGRVRYPLLVLVGAVGFLMLIVCANLSNLLLARAAVRQKEMAIRSALGAGRRRLIRQMLIESLTLSGCGAALGLVLATGGTQLLARIEGTSIPLLQQVRVDAEALGFALLMAVLTGILFGLMPALQASAFTPHTALKENSRGSVGGMGRGWLRGSLVVSEIALACVLLTGAGLLLRSLSRVLDVELGFESDNVFAVRVDPGRAYSTRAQRNAYFDEVLRNVASVPGVEAVGLTDALPLGDNFGWRTWAASAKGQVSEDGQRQSPLVRMIDDGYLAAMKIPLRAGRGFTPADNASSEPVIIINETLARMLWPGEDALGRIIVTSGTERRVVGVVAGVRYFALEQDSGLEMYMPLKQTGDYQSVDLVVKGAFPPAALVPGVRAALKRVDPHLPATEFRTLRQLVDHSVFARRFVLLLIGGFAGFGLILASLGIYGVISYAVNQRKQEIGIRMALGASAVDLQKGILIETLRLAAVGIALGLAAVWGLGQAIEGLLFGVTPADPVTFAAALMILMAVAALAGYLPARRASRINPIVALRAD